MRSERRRLPVGSTDIRICAAEALEGRRMVRCRPQRVGRACHAGLAANTEGGIMKTNRPPLHAAQPCRWAHPVRVFLLFGQ